MVVKRKRKGKKPVWCVIHCSKTGKKKTIKCHSTKKKAKAQHAAISISKARRKGHKIPRKK